MCVCFLLRQNKPKTLLCQTRKGKKIWFFPNMAFLSRTSVLRSAVIGAVQRASLQSSGTPFQESAKKLALVGGHLHHYHHQQQQQQRFCSSQRAEEAESKSTSSTEDLPDPTMENPFLKEKRCCILCRHDIQVDYKNVRLLTQFVSPYTGRMYDKHITGLCEAQHRAVRSEIQRSQRFGLMSRHYRDPKYANDPRLFDPTRPTRANPY